MPDAPELISVAVDGSAGDGVSFSCQITPDGRYVVFTSNASNLVSGDNNGSPDVFLRDTLTNTTTCISVDDNGALGLNTAQIDLSLNSIAANGDLVVFSDVSDLDNDPSGQGGIFLRDLSQGTTIRLTDDLITFDHPSISPNGEYVGLSKPSELDGPAVDGLYAEALSTGILNEIDVGLDGSAGNGESIRASFSLDGRYVAFQSTATNLVQDDSDTGSFWNIYIRDTVADTTIRIDVPSSNLGSSAYQWPSISADGRYVTFWDTSQDIIYLYDDVSRTLTNIGSGEAPSISSNGRYVTFVETNNSDEVVLYDRTTGTLTNIGIGDHPTVSNDGSVVFQSGADGEIYLFRGQDQPPIIDEAASSLSGTISERPDVTGSGALDTASGDIAFSDADAGDRPTASVISQSIIYTGPGGNQITLTNEQTVALEGAFSITSEPGNTSSGKIDWSYSIADKTLDFLDAGDTVTITSTVQVDDHNGGTVTQDVAITVHGSNDAPNARPDFAITALGAARSADVLRGLLANDFDSDAHDKLSLVSISYGNTTYSFGTVATETIRGRYGTLTLNGDGSYTYAANHNNWIWSPQGQVHDQFTYSVTDGHGGTATSTLDIGITVPTRAPSLHTAANIFGQYGSEGKLVFLATLADASYTLAPGVEVAGLDINGDSAFADNLYDNRLPAGFRLLTASQLPSLSPENVNSVDFPTKGLVDGIYLNQNAAALVGRSADALFIAFRGSNDGPLWELLHGGTPDQDDWTAAGMQTYYSLLKPLIAATDRYLSVHPGLTHVYVTGHSLGASMVEKYMATHLGLKYEAITFANPGWPGTTLLEAPRISNVFNLNDPIEHFTAYKVPGDRYELCNYHGSDGGFLNLHDMQLYYDVSLFLSKYHYMVPISGLSTNGIHDVTMLFATVLRDAANSADPWRVTMPSGKVIGTAHNDVIGITNGGTLTGGGGNDTFIFDRGFGRVTVTDYHPGIDSIQFERILFQNFSSLYDHVSEHAGGAIIKFDGLNTVKLDGVTKQMILHHESDFLFV